MLGFRNLKQYSNISLPKEIKIEEINNHNYYVFTSSPDKNIIKIGYCCETRGTDYPIYIDEREYPLSIDGIYEMYSKNNDDIIKVKEIKIPSGFIFTLDIVEEDENKYY